MCVERRVCMYVCMYICVCISPTAILIIIEGQFQVFQRFFRRKLVLRTVESCLVALNHYENGSRRNTYTYIHIYIHTYIPFFLHTYLYICVKICVNYYENGSRVKVCVHLYMHIHMCVCMQRLVWTCHRVDISKCVCVCVYVYMHICMCAYGYERGRFSRVNNNNNNIHECMYGWMYASMYVPCTSFLSNVA